jgi:hypothetical protein
LVSLNEIEIRPVNPLIPGDEIGVEENEFAKMLRVLSLSINNNP